MVWEWRGLLFAAAKKKQSQRKASQSDRWRMCVTAAFNTVKGSAVSLSLDPGPSRSRRPGPSA